MSLSMMVVRLKFYFAWTVGKICGLFTKREVNMAGYWPSYFLCFHGPRLVKLRSMNTQKKNEANIQPSWPKKLGE